LQGQGGNRTRFDGLNGLAPRLGSDVGIASQHRRTYMSHDIKHHAFGNASLSQLGAKPVSEVVQSACDTGGFADAFPCSFQRCYGTCTVHRPGAVRKRIHVPNPVGEGPTSARTKLRGVSALGGEFGTSEFAAQFPPSLLVLPTVICCSTKFTWDQRSIRASSLRIPVHMRVIR
jgi:hypothetical protein